MSKGSAQPALPPAFSVRRKPVVYLIAQPTVSRTKKNMNLDPLYNHGDLKVLIPAGESPAFNPTKCIEIMAARFEHFDPTVDFLVWGGGDTLSAVMAGFLLSERNIQVFNWLRYERKRLPDGTRVDDGAIYVPVKVDLREPQMDLDISPNDDEDEQP
jgi:hypothetical protein